MYVPSKCTIVRTMGRIAYALSGEGRWQRQTKPQKKIHINSVDVRKMPSHV